MLPPKALRPLLLGPVLGGLLLAVSTAGVQAAEAEAHSFNDVAFGSPLATVAALPPAAARISREHSQEDAPSLGWVAVSGLAVAAVAARRYRRHVPLLGNRTQAWAPAPAAHDDTDAQGWRLSRIEDLPEHDLHPLYSSLDDTDTWADSNVVPLHRAHRPAPAQRPSNTAPSRCDPEVIDVEPRVIRTAKPT